MTIPNADAILALGVDDLKMLRCEVTESMPEEGTPPEAYFGFLILMSAVQDMRGWSRLAEPGSGPTVARLGWGAEATRRAREADRRSLESHREAAERFKALGGRSALQAAVDALNLA